MKKYIVYTDGGSRGNPGKAAIGVVVLDEAGKVMAKFGQYLGDGLTNNEAEYQAVLAAFKKLREMVGEAALAQTAVEIRSDSELLVNQMSGRYKIKNENIRMFVVNIQRLMEGFASVKYIAIPREQNKLADALVNQALDAQI